MGVTKVHDDYRTNGLSLIPGGKTVTVTYGTGYKFIYDKIKNPGMYIKSISEKDKSKGDIVRIEVDGKEAWTSLSKTNPWDI